MGSIGTDSSPEPYYDLGTYKWTVTSDSPEARLWANRGLIWAYSFNHEEGIKCFKEAVKHDPSCAIAHWGVAFCSGPNYNKAWALFGREDVLKSSQLVKDALDRALELSTQASPAEQKLIKALGARFPPVGTIPDDFSPLNRAYADAMRPVYEAHPDDVDVAALFAEALLCISPRGLWDLDTGKPTGDHTVEAQNVIERAFESPEGFAHPAHCHLYIHLLEMSPVPELALPAADRLRGMVPNASHMLHMPTHIDAAVGDYRRGISSNDEAMAADDAYFAKLGPLDCLLYRAYRAHYVSAKLYSSIMAGRYFDALSAANKMEEILPEYILTAPSRLPLADIMEPFLGSKAHVLIRFGRWEDILNLPIPSNRELYCSTYAVTLYARGIALSALNRIPEAEATYQEFLLAREKVPMTRLNSIPVRQYNVLGVAEKMLAGEIAYRKGDFDTAFSILREAAAREDNLQYSDPPPWMQPVRHALGGLLLEQGRVAEAERVFREDLGCAEGYPRRKAKLNNVWGLQGLHESLVRGGKEDEARLVKPGLDVAMAGADVELNVSCFCRLEKVGQGKGFC
ncbi:unnamed protein product [Zymoseptoria tritici ST99CH_3D7]|uniref:MalT-like TPR region domain-containing protein n=1 Tax=Zymoseptoria tritici (strain ST99CH_3D7) TaxID=1276538 RepID=A0A1X7RL57_ZYMT9|nr:unnamed protein product [Zymoseptoria tritici ST99CH_3D7]